MINIIEKFIKSMKIAIILSSTQFDVPIFRLENTIEAIILTLIW